jgi:gliding motility-associated-like protein
MTRFGCANRDSFIVTVNAKPVVQTLSDTSICHGSSIVLNTQSSGASTFSWSPVTSLSNPNISSPAANPNVTTQYVVTAFSAQNCKVKDTINLNVSPTPTVNLGPDRSICKGDSLVLDAGNSGAGFLWQNAASTQTIFAKDSGFYYVTVTNGCFASDTMHLSFYPDPSINVMNDTAACMQTSFIISTQTSGNYIYSWSPVTGLSSATVANPVLTVSGTRRYYLTATNSFNCKAVDSVLVTKKDLPVVNLGKDTSICGGQSISLDAQNPGGVYLWSNGNSSQTISVNAPGTYSVNVTKNGCSNADTIVISRKTKVFNLVPAIAAVCYEDSLRLQASGGSLYEWFLNGVPTGLIDSTIKVWPRVPGIYSVKVTETQCGFTDTLYSTVFIKPAPVISVTKSNDISCANPRAQLKATGAFSYKWTPATFITNDAVASPYVYPVVNTWYHVKGKGIDGCTVEDSVQVLMDSAAFVKFYVPTAFTPNQDGKNDCLKVLYGGFVKDFEFVIYNRWGEIVFKTTDISKCWDGYTNGRKQPNDVYVYIMNGANDCGKVSKKGIVTLIY